MVMEKSKNRRETSRLYLQKAARNPKLVGSLVFAVILVAVAAVYFSNSHDPVEHSSNPAVQAYADKLPELKEKAKDQPKNAKNHNDYAVALYATGDTKTAKTEYEKAVNLDGSNATTYNNLGNVYRDLNEIDKAVVAYQKAISLNPRLVNPYFNLANIQTYSQKDVDAAIQTYQKALKVLPDNVQVLLSLAVAYQNKNDKAKAEQVYNTIIAQDANNTAAKAGLERLKK